MNPYEGKVEIKLWYVTSQTKFEVEKGVIPKHFLQKAISALQSELDEISDCPIHEDD